MCQEIDQKFDDIIETIRSLCDVDDSVFDNLQRRSSELPVQINFQRTFSKAALGIRRGDTPAVRQINLNIKQLSAARGTRWLDLQKLSCPQIIFSIMAFSRLASIPNGQFNCLLHNLPKALEVQDLGNWYIRENISSIILGGKITESTKLFIRREFRSILLGKEALNNWTRLLGPHNGT